MSFQRPTLEVYVEQGKLRYRVSKGVSSPELNLFLSQHKDALRALLTLPAGGECESLPATTPHNSQNPQKALACDFSGDCGDSGNSQGSAGTVANPSVGSEEAAPSHLLVTRPEDLPAVRVAIDNTLLVGLDIETTGLDPCTDRLRLLSLATDTIDGGSFVYIVDCFTVDPAPLFDILAEKEVVIHHAAFDLGFLTRLGFVPDVVRDTMLMAQLLAAGTTDRCTLAACVERELGKRLDKAGQKSDWSRQLTDAQLTYAVRDAEVLAPLYRALARKVEKAGLVEAVRIEERCLPAVVWMAGRGVGFDRTAWEAVSREAADEARRLRVALEAEAPRCPGALTFQDSGWNWDSPAQVKEALALKGCPVDDTTDDTLAATGHPFAELLRRYRSAQKASATYGDGWLKHVAGDGRVFADWHQCGAKTGRMSSASPNLQNLPRDSRYRRCFVAPPGRVLVKADYSQVELRIAAKVSADAVMTGAYRRGDDLHTLTAQGMTGKDSVTKEERQLAKPANFGLIYGLGVPSLRRKAKTDYGLDLSEADARRYRDAFFRAYPGIRRWHNQIRRARATETRTLTGRRVLVKPDDFFGGKANYVVQGTGGDAIKGALALLWERRAQCPGAFPVLAVHDELVVECDEVQAEAVADWLKGAMVDALAPLITPVPVEVEVKTGRTWAGD
jgi:DNA polymerase-1